MKTTQYPGPNFNAIPISKTMVQKYDKVNHTYKPCFANVVELIPENNYDKRAINTAVGKWDYDLFGTSIAKSFNDMTEKLCYNRSDRVYAITTQDKNFDELKPNKILGFVEMFEHNGQNNVDMLYLQAKPKKNYFSETPSNYNHIGKALVSEMQNVYHNKKISVYSVEEATPFYEYMGFVHEEGGRPNSYYWKK